MENGRSGLKDSLERLPGGEEEARYRIQNLIDSCESILNALDEAALTQGLKDAVNQAAQQPTREAELRTTVLGALSTEDYEELTVAEVTKRLDDLSADELKKLREFEKRNKDRESLVERIDRKIRGAS